MGDMEKAELGEYESLPDSEKNPVATIVLLVVVGAFASAIAFGLGVGMRPPVFAALQEGSALSEIQMLPVNSSSHGVSEKKVGVPVDGRLSPYPWTNAELQWQHTAFHFQPEKNWMNDPNGPLYYRGWYHLFYQYNPESAVWGNITWAHAVSRDLIHWLYLDLAMIRDQWYDINGVWTGSATVLPDGRVIMMYTGCTNESVQVQNLAFPEDPLDPLLQKWVKAPRNPVLLPPRGIGLTDFRDPTTAWLGRDGLWRICIGSKAEHGRAGIALVYRTRDFTTFELQRQYLHEVAGTGMWECVDFYPVASSGTSGLNTSASGFGVKHVLKASLDDNRRDYYAIGTYEPAEERFAPDDPEMDVGLGLRYDYGEFYASKTFFEPVKQRRILWGWVAEMDSEQADLRKEWASLQAVPRAVWFDSKTGANLIQWPVEEIELLRTSHVSEENLVLGAESVVRVNGSTGAQLDVEIVFDFPEEPLNNALEEDAIYSCSSSGGAAERGALGPFGLLVLANENLIEQTAVYFYITKAANGHYRTHICNDETRSSLASDLIKRVYGNIVTVLSDERTISLRVLVDHSIVETYAQGGRTCITSRVYPTQAVYDAARLFLFNNGTTPITVRRLDAWQMASVSMHPYEM